MNHLHSRESQRKGRWFQVFLNRKRKQDKGRSASKRYEEFRRYLKTYKKITTKIKIKGARKKKKKKKRSESHPCTGALLAVPP